MVDPAGYRTDPALARWVQRGIDFASTLPGNEVRRTTKRNAAAGEGMFGKVRDRFLAEPDVSEGTSFGATPGLRVGGKIFAMLGRDDDLVVKLPKSRMDLLIDAGIGARFDPRRDGRLMKEWVSIPVRHGRMWSRLAEEALRFVRIAARKPSAKPKAQIRR